MKVTRPFIPRERVGSGDETRGGLAQAQRITYTPFLGMQKVLGGFTEIKFIEFKFAGRPMGINAWNNFVLRVEHPYNFLSVASQLASA